MLITVATGTRKNLTRKNGAALGGGAAGSRIGRVAEHLPTEGTSRSWCTLPTLSSRPTARAFQARGKKSFKFYT